MIDRAGIENPELTGTGIKNQHLTETGTGIKNLSWPGPGQLKITNPGKFKWLSEHGGMAAVRMVIIYCIQIGHLFQPVWL